MISPFAQQVHKLLKTVPKGRVTTYQELANAMGTKAYRAIGQVMRSNPYAPHVPCHRVVASNGMLGGFMGERSGPKVLKKIHLLKKEGVIVHGNKVVDFEKKLWRFKSPQKSDRPQAKGRILQPTIRKK